MGFEIILASLTDREKVAAAIYYDNAQWLEISEEAEGFVIQFYPHPRQSYWEFPLDEALEALEGAKKGLL